MEIRPASISQVVTGRDGRFIAVDDDVSGVAADLHALDESFRLRYSEAGGYFVVYQILSDGSEHLVLTSLECSPLIVHTVRRIMHPSYDLAGEMERKDARAVKARNDALDERTGVMGERLHHAIGKDLGFKPRIIVPRDV